MQHHLLHWLDNDLTFLNFLSSTLYGWTILQSSIYAVRSHFSVAASGIQVAQSRDQGALHAQFAASFALPTTLYFATAG